MHIFIHMCKEVKRLIIVTAGKWQKNARHEKCYGSEKKFLKIKIIKILFYSVIIKEVVQYYIFVLDQYLDIKLHSSRVKGHHVELWWFLLQKYRNENIFLSNDIKQYPRRVREGHHVELWWYFLQKYRNENILISNDIKQYPRRVREGSRRSPVVGKTSPSRRRSEQVGGTKTFSFFSV